MDKSYEIHLNNSNKSAENFIRLFTDYAKSEWPSDVQVTTT